MFLDILERCRALQGNCVPEVEVIENVEACSIRHGLCLEGQRGQWKGMLWILSTYTVCIVEYAFLGTLCQVDHVRQGLYERLPLHVDVW